MLTFVSDIAIFVLKRDVKLQLTNYMLTWSQNGVQQSRDVRQPIGIATSRVAQLRQLFFIYGFGFVITILAKNS